MDRDPQPPPAPGGRPPAVSVVIPCYRQAEYLPFAVSSVALQTFRDWEIVVVDDGSPDDTAAVTRQLIKKLAGRRIRLLRQPNRGLAEARNAGIRASRGRYVLPLDADDGIDREFLAKTVAVLEREPGISIVATDLAKFGAAEGVIPANPEAPLPVLLVGNQQAYCSLYRREVFEAVGGYAPDMPVAGYEDWNFWISAAERGFRARRVPEPLLLYRVKSQSMITTANRHDRQLRAWIALRHPALFSEAQRAAAAEVLQGSQAAEADAGQASAPAAPAAPAAPSPYDEAFYGATADGSRRAAARIVPLVREWVGAASVLDVGCGVGAFLRAFQEAGAAEVLGIDGDYVPRDRLLVDPACFRPVDVAHPFDLGRTFDLVVSLEVAEHVPPERADGFVASLCRHGHVVLFSAAVPQQGGNQHVNERWPSYWIERFRAHGHEPFDVVRPALWADDQVEYWYRQNCLLFADPTGVERNPRLAGARGAGLLSGAPDVVHPAAFAARSGEAQEALQLLARLGAEGGTYAFRRGERGRLSIQRVG
ncbi:MAG TPA: glycosyltransferase [Anaeromyxobacter sp.]|nr:glycosyltransferase [Anaeromyxobacter sp.]